MKARILLVDDDPILGKTLLPGLEQQGYTVDFVTDGRAAVNMAINWHPDLILLDIEMRPIDGITVCKQIRSWSQVPIIMLTIRNAEQDKIAALDLGADDYLTKPFGVGELLARVRVALRRAEQLAMVDNPVIHIGDLYVDIPNHCVLFKDQRLRLPLKEYEVLRVLAINVGRVLTQRAILQAVWGVNYDEHDSALLRRVIAELRRKIEPDPSHPKYIVTEPGIGYRLAIE